MMDDGVPDLELLGEPLGELRDDERFFRLSDTSSGDRGAKEPRRELECTLSSLVEENGSGSEGLSSCLSLLIR